MISSLRAEIESPIRKNRFSPDQRITPVTFFRSHLFFMSIPYQVTGVDFKSEMGDPIPHSPEIFNKFNLIWCFWYNPRLLPLGRMNEPIFSQTTGLSGPSHFRS